VRLPFPERISLFYVLVFATLLCIAQVLEGTSGLFSLCSFLFIMIAGIAFNLAGGFTRPSGSYVFFYAVLGVIVGLFWKAVLGEPADSNLLAPRVTIEVYLGGICAMLFAVYISRKLATKRPLLGTMLEDTKMQNATIGCMVVGMLLVGIMSVVPHGTGSVLSALQQLDRFLPLAIIIGVTHQIRRSGGTSSINLPVLISIVFSFFAGIVGFSKEGMLTPLLCWVIAASCMRYRVSLAQIAGGALAAIFIFQYLVPYSQYGRQYRSTSFSEQFDASIDLLSRLGYVRQQNALQQADDDQASSAVYYNTPQGFFDRLQMISPDDTLIAFTEQNGPYGVLPLIQAFENLVPHVFWPSKPAVITGNFYDREMGNLPEEDTTTGISFTPTGEAYHLARWTGVLVIAPTLWIVLFVIFDSLCGDVRKSPWGLLACVVFSHAAPEGLLTGVIYMYFYTTVMIVIAAVSASYIMPLIGTFLAGPEGLRIVRTGAIRSFPRRFPNSRA